jgi:hypothetical protein
MGWLARGGGAPSMDTNGLVCHSIHSFVICMSISLYFNIINNLGPNIQSFIFVQYYQFSPWYLNEERSTLMPGVVNVLFVLVIVPTAFVTYAYAVPSFIVMVPFLVWGILHPNQCAAMNASC